MDGQNLAKTASEPSTFENFIKHGLYLRAWSPATASTYRRAWARKLPTEPWRSHRER
jgi:hypothetical protein